MIQTGYKQDKVTSDFHYLQLTIKHVQGQMNHMIKKERNYCKISQKTGVAAFGSEEGGYFAYR
jgi:hypothetical protein